MKKRWAQIQTLANSVVGKTKMRKSMMTVVTMAVLTAFFVLQFYFVRELVAAELLFGLAFAILFALGGLAYLVGSVGERGLELGEAGVRMIGDSARRGFRSLSFGRTHSTHSKSSYPASTGLHHLSRRASWGPADNS